jgi:hypothetical protein
MHRKGLTIATQRLIKELEMISKVVVEERFHHLK